MDKVTRGLQIIQNRIERSKNLRLAHSERLTDRRAYGLQLESDKTSITLVAAHEFVSDLPATKRYQASVEEYFWCLDMRLENFHPFDFYCKSGAALNIEIDRFLKPLANRAASYLRVNAKDIRFPDALAKCVVIITYAVYAVTDELGTDPFRREKLVVNSVRSAVDQQQVAFHPAASQPSQLQEVMIDSALAPVPPTSSSDLHRFVTGKVYRIAFKRGNRATKVWLTDPWDAEYLGVDVKALRQAAEVLEAQKVIGFLPDPGLGWAAEGLLQASSTFEGSPTELRKIGFTPG